MEDWTDNNDGSVSDPDGNIYDYDGNWIGYENGNGTWTDENGALYTWDNRPINEGGFYDNGDGTWTSVYTGETVQGGGTIGEGSNGNETTVPADWIDNQNGTVTDPKSGDVWGIDGTWLGNTRDDGSNPGFWSSLGNSLKSLFGAPTGRTNNGQISFGNAGNAQSAAQAIQQLRALQQQANLNGTAAQRTAINAALARADATTSTTSPAVWVAGGALALLALAAMKKRRVA